jgi:putative PIN family toxin of toxin-antitoxin system
VVLDTNAVLDAWLFKNPAIQPLADAIEAGQVRWLACATMRDELDRAGRFKSLAGWKPDSAHLLTCLDRWAKLLPDPTPSPLPRLRCTDPDDQVFVDLALQAQAQWLITHDRALLKLAKRARPLGLWVMPPALWLPVLHPLA